MRESPAIEMFRVVHRCGMANLLRHCYLNKDSGTFTARKSLVKRVVWEYEWRRLRHITVFWMIWKWMFGGFFASTMDNTTELCNGSIIENTTQADANISRLIIYDMPIVQRLGPRIGSACIILLFGTESGTPWCLASCKIHNAQSYDGQPAQPQWYYQTNTIWDRRKLYQRVLKHFPKMFIAFTKLELTCICKKKLRSTDRTIKIRLCNFD